MAVKPANTGNSKMLCYKKPSYGGYYLGMTENCAGILYKLLETEPSSGSRAEHSNKNLRFFFRKKFSSPFIYKRKQKKHFLSP